MAPRTPCLINEILSGMKKTYMIIKRSFFYAVIYIFLIISDGNWAMGVCVADDSASEQIPFKHENILHSGDYNSILNGLNRAGEIKFEANVADMKTLSNATPLVSTTPRMISYRHQEHMWQTGDGAIHLLINQGRMDQEGDGLVLFSSFDNGQSWHEMVSFAGSGDISTSDGFLSGNALYLSYNNSDGEIIVVNLLYDEISGAWQTLQEEVAFSAVNYKGVNSTIAFDDQGRLWCAFVVRQVGTRMWKIKIIQKEDEFADWQTTAVELDTATVSNSPEESVRLISSTNGIGAVYTSRENIKWAYRANEWPADCQWDEEILFTRHFPYPPDPYASHFNTAVDELENIHLVAVDQGRLIYIRYNRAVQAWLSPRTLTFNLHSGYVQLTMVQKQLFVFFNIFSNIGLFRSNDHGNSFEFTDYLIHPNDQNDYSYPRIETPGICGSVIPIVQQYFDKSLQRLLYFYITIE